jgi:hypothetical protein
VRPGRTLVVAIVAWVVTGVVVGIVGAGCAPPPPLSLHFVISDDPSQSCPSTSCSQVAVRCDAILSIRILVPDDPTAPYVSVCEPVTGRRDLCSIAGIDLPADATVPNRTLEVQVALYPATAIPSDPVTGKLICPSDLQFSPSNLVVAVDPTPAVAGRAFYHPGDAETVVALGCPDLSLVNADSCVGANKTLINATADRFTVSAGEPRATINPSTQQTQYILGPTEATVLDRTVFGPVPAWSADLSTRFATSACLEVLEDGAQSTTSVTCRAATPAATRVDLRGLRLAKATLEQLLVALALPRFPDDGLVVGMVVDYLGNPAPGVVIHPSAGTVQYLSADRTTTTGLTATTVSGIFLSRDAPYRATWVTQTSAAAQLGVGFGGLIAGKATIVVLQLDQPTTVGM